MTASSLHAATQRLLCPITQGSALCEQLLAGVYTVILYTSVGEEIIAKSEAAEYHECAVGCFEPSLAGAGIAADALSDCACANLYTRAALTRTRTRAIPPKAATALGGSYAPDTVHVAQL